MRRATALLAGLALTAAAPLAIAHRGASGERPEHTLAAYSLAIDEGADFVECDAVATRDGVPVCRHENEIGGTTDVAAHPEFAGRKATKTFDGTAVSGWFTEDFTLAELKTLRARERLPELRPANKAYDGKFEVPTLEEAIGLVKAARRPVGIYVETKHPAYFAQLGLALEPKVAAILRRHGYARTGDAAFLESFDPASLKALRELTGVRLIQLVETNAEGDAMITDAGLTAIAGYADGIGPEKSRIVPRDGVGRRTAPTDLVARAHRAGLLVHPWTVRAENAFLPIDLRIGSDPRGHGNAAAEVAQLYALGVDGLFSDFPTLLRGAIRQREALDRRNISAHPVARRR